MKVSMSAVRTSTPANLQRIQTPALESNPQDISDIGRSSQEMGPDGITPFVRAAGGAVIGVVGGIGAGVYYGMQHGAAAGIGGALAGAVVGGGVGWVCGALYHKAMS